MFAPEASGLLRLQGTKCLTTALSAPLRRLLCLPSLPCHPNQGQLDVQGLPKPSCQRQLDVQGLPKTSFQRQLDVQGLPKTSFQGQLDVQGPLKPPFQGQLDVLGPPTPRIFVVCRGSNDIGGDQSPRQGNDSDGTTASFQRECSACRPDEAMETTRRGDGDDGTMTVTKIP